MEQETAKFEADARAFADSVRNLETTLAALIECPLDDQLAAIDAPLDRASRCATLAYITHSLAFLYLRTQGATKGHPVRKELQRVKEYMDKIAKISAQSSKGAQIDQDAAQRFIKHSLSSNPDIKQKYVEAQQKKQSEEFLNTVLNGEANNSTPPSKIQGSYTKGEDGKSSSKRRRDGDQSSKQHNKAPKTSSSGSNLSQNTPSKKQK
ncbi:hypothetical protein HDU83_001923 [Entophlyctis luteolus]|nr:hypothetical protein HDU83_001923 [Entophlyctis luteolus]